MIVAFGIILWFLLGFFAYMIDNHAKRIKKLEEKLR